MRKLIFVLAGACLLSASTAAAQQDKKFYLGVKAGLNVPDLTTASDNPLSDGWTSKLGGIYGITAEYRFSKHWSILSGLEYTEMGGKKNGLQALPSKRLETNINAAAAAGIAAQQGIPVTMITMGAWSNKYTYVDIDNKSEFNYFQIPVQARYSLPFGSRFRFVANFGMYAAYMVEAKNVTSGTSQLFTDDKKTPLTLSATITGVPTPIPVPFTTQIPISETRNIYDDTYHFNYGIIGGAGIGMDLWKGELMLNVGGQYGFQKIQKSAENGQNRIGAGSFTLGYAFRL